MVDDVLLKIANPSLDNGGLEWLDTQDFFAKECVSSIYYPIFKDDAISARGWQNDKIDTWDKYAALLKECMDHGYPVEVLMQDPRGVSVDVMKKYLDMGIKKYTFFDDKSAYNMKCLDPDTFIECTITRTLSPYEIAHGDFSMYDEICLYFWFNMNFDAIKALPQTIKYSICGNTGCMPFCSHCLNHWFSNEMHDCVYSDMRENDQFVMALSYKAYKAYLQPYIHRIKILDRLDNVDENISHICEFFDSKVELKPYDYYNKKMPFPTILNKERLNEYMDSHRRS